MPAAPDIRAAELIERYEGLLLDAYGVLVDADQALPGAVELIRELDHRGRPYLIVTNDASRLPSSALARYRALGLPIDDEARIVTSGSVLAPYFREHGLTGKRCGVLGPPDSDAYVRLAGGVLSTWPIDDPEQLDVLVVGDEAGFPFVQRLDQALSAAIRRVDSGAPLHLLLPNPDLIYPKAGGDFGVAAGSLALVLETGLGLRFPASRDVLRFVPLGKPAAPIYRAALERIGTKNVCFVGDQLETDVRGARAFGIPVALALTGVTRAVPDSLLPELRPDYVLKSLSL